ncbi:MAG: L,D-transpeptidase family protein [Kiritimatiellae bacterium]|nr:L,D-transpeptidase family protein [Kiritimatiellia bacterium]MDW8457610.1 L,D-transpeptidase family protein [Verrucomicrobiota bacterium]
MAQGLLNKRKPPALYGAHWQWNMVRFAGILTLAVVATFCGVGCAAFQRAGAPAGTPSLPANVPPAEDAPIREAMPPPAAESAIAAPQLEVPPLAFARPPSPFEPGPPPPGPADVAPPPVLSPLDVARVQIMLDRDNFSPGAIDGRWGPNSRAALREWLRASGLPITGEIDQEILRRAPPDEEAFGQHTVSYADYSILRPFPRDWRARAALDLHGHETILELIAERYHASERFIRELNPGLDWPNPPAGTIIRVPKVRPYKRATGSRVEIVLSEKVLRVYDAENRLIARFPCSIGKRAEKRPVGELQIINAAEMPNYTFDPQLFADDPLAAGIDRRLVLPPGPNNPVGVVWLGLDRPGYGIHGTPFPEEIGKTESHGCFRLANWNARKLLEMVAVGCPVVVRPSADLHVAGGSL